MSNKPQVPAVEGWYSLDADNFHLIGSCCKACGTYYFPKLATFCKNPSCDSEEFDEVPLSNEGKIWSYTNSCYQPPLPYVSAEPFEPYTLAAVKLEKEQMIVMGQVADGYTVDDLKVGDDMVLVLDTLHETEDEAKTIWKWKPRAS